MDSASTAFVTNVWVAVANVAVRFALPVVRFVSAAEIAFWSPVPSAPAACVTESPLWPAYRPTAYWYSAWAVYQAFGNVHADLDAAPAGTAPMPTATHTAAAPATNPLPPRIARASWQVHIPPANRKIGALRLRGLTPSLTPPCQFGVCPLFDSQAWLPAAILRRLIVSS